MAVVYTTAVKAETDQSVALGTILPMEAAAPAARVVKVGMYVNSVHQVEVDSSAYDLDAFLWFKWRGSFDPTTTVDIINMVEEWGAMVVPLNDEPALLPDGSSYQLLKVQGRFLQPFSFADYPLDRQKLSVYLEDNTYGADDLVYEMDAEGSGFGPTLSIPGWQVEGWSSQQLRHDYGSVFGAQGAGGPSVYSTLRFDLDIARPTGLFVWKLMLPLIVVLAAALMALVFDPRLVEVRTSLPALGILAMVVLQQSYSDALPDAGHFVLMDKIYAVAYAMIVLTLLRTIRTSRSDLGVGTEAEATRLADRKLLVGQAIGFAAAVALIIATR